jgi:hypothetical protein
MPRVNFDDVQDGQPRERGTPAGPGEYVAKVVWTRATQKEKGEYWDVMLEVVQPEGNKGQVVFDGISWAPGALPRTKLVLAAMGLNVSEEKDWQSDDIKDRYVRVRVEKHSDPNYPNKTTKVPYEGYSALTQAEADSAAEAKYGF